MTTRHFPLTSLTEAHPHAAGCLDGAKAARIFGRARPAPGEPCPTIVDLFIDGAHIGGVPAIPPAGGGQAASDGLARFRFVLPPDRLDGQEHEIRAVRRQDGRELDGSPLRQRLGRGPAAVSDVTPEAVPARGQPAVPNDAPSDAPSDARPDAPSDIGPEVREAGDAGDMDLTCLADVDIPPGLQPLLDAVGANSGRLLVVYPIITWEFRWQRPQQIVSRLAEAGYAVLYLAHAPIEALPAGPAEALVGVGVTPLADNVFCGWLSSVGNHSIYQDPLDGPTLEAMAMGLSAILTKADPLDLVHLLHFPGWQPLAARMADCHGGRVVYDCMDHHAGFSTNTSDVLAREERLIAEADLVVASSLLLEKELRTKARDVLLAKNAAHYEHFADPAKNGELDHLADRPIIGYIGAIADWFDIELVEYCAASRPEWSFVLIGSTALCDTSRAERLDNVHFLGEKPFSSLPGYLAYFDVCTIPFRIIPLTEATNPVKFYEYMSAGKPVVSTPLPELEPYAAHVVLAGTPEDFLAGLERALAESRDPERMETRRALARANDWSGRVETILSHPVFADYRTPRGLYKASVILVTYNGLEEATRDCVESILANTPPGQYELIVVDNLSVRDDTRAYLRQLDRDHRHVRIKLNPMNKGYAGGNNDGMRMAVGDVVILLNNDTLAPPGWLGSLVEPFELGRDVGMVGPVTNSCGNVQCVNIPGITPGNYQAMAAEYLALNRGAVFEVSRLGFFCVAVRRELMDMIGLLDECFGLGMFEDDDYCIRAMRAGWRCLVTEGCFIYHKGSASFSKLDVATYKHIFETNRALFETRHDMNWSFADIAIDYLDKISLDLGIAASGFGAPGAALGRMTHRIENLRHLLNHLRGVELESRPPLSALAPKTLSMPVGYDNNSLITRFGQLRRKHFTGRAIVMPATVDFGFMVQRPQHLARAFSRLGYTVLYGTLSRQGDAVRVWRRAEENVILVNQELFPYLSHALRPEEAVYFCPWPHNVRERRRVPHSFFVYDFIDDLSLLELDPVAVRGWHDQCLREADLITVSADLLAEQIPAEYRGKLLMARNAVSDAFVEALAGPGEVAPELKELGEGPVIGYLGAIAPWMDFGLLERAARELSHCRFVLVGPIMGVEAKMAELTGRLPNLTVLPPRPHGRMVEFLRGFDVATIPFVLDQVTQAVSPVKLFEYMAAGIPIVTTAMRECARYSEVLTAGSEADYVDKLRRALALGADPARIALSRQRAAENTWRRRAVDIAARFPGGLGIEKG